MFRIIHLTDPHIGPLPPAAFSQLMGKRITGWFNWKRGRQRIHDMTIMSAILDDMALQPVDHIACTGDICNLGLPGEWPAARKYLETLGTPERVSYVPGNHDAYVRGSLEGLLQACKPYMLGDGSDTISFPYLRRRGKIALIGLSSAIPTPPFKAYGALGSEQLQKLENLLLELSRDSDCIRVILIHHPPYIGGASARRGLNDAEGFEKVVSRAGAELVLFGHNHISSLVYFKGPRGPVPIVGAPSVSADHDEIRRRAAYHFFHIDMDGKTLKIGMESRGRLEDGSVGQLGFTTILPQSAS